MPDEETPFHVKPGKPVADPAGLPTGKGFASPPPPPVPEVQGHRSPGAYYSCGTCGWTSFIPEGADWFTCAYGHFNAV